MSCGNLGPAGLDLCGITAGPRHIVPRTGIEPVTKRISLSGCYGVSMTIKIRVLAGVLVLFDAYGMSVFVVVFV